MNISIPEDLKSNATVADLQEQLDRIRSQILHCVAEANHHVKHIELIDKRVQALAIEEEKISILLDKLKSYRFCH